MRIARNYSILVLLALVILAFESKSYAQQGRGVIQGRVLDTSGAVVPKASVSATNATTGVTTVGKTNAAGTYYLPYLPPGLYTLTASAQGFKLTKRPGIELSIAQVLQVDLTLQVGATRQSVTVTAQTPLLDTTNPNLGQVINSRLISQLPTTDGSPMSLVYLTPGIANTYPAAPSMVEAPELQQNAITQSAFAGLPRGTVDFSLNGVPNTQNSIADYGSGFVNSPPADIVSQFKVETPFDASVGHTSGMVVNFVLKTGTSHPHGSVWFVDRQPGWMANNWFANRAGLPPGNFTYHRWGASLTTPVVIPKIYNGRGHTFFTFGYEDLSEVQAGGTFITTVPTAAERQGDFSALLALGPQYQIYNPATITPVGNGRYSLQPFDGNIIPPSSIDPIATAILTHYVMPNTQGTAAGVNNFINPDVATPRGYYNLIGRIDHIISTKQRFTATIAANLRTDGPYRVYWPDPAMGENWSGPAKQVGLEDNYTFSPTLMLDVRYGMNYYAGGHQPQYVGFDPAQLGFTGTTETQLTSAAKFFPEVSTSGLHTLASEWMDVMHSTNHSVFASLSKVHGNQIIKTGVEFRAYQLNQWGAGQASGRFNFDTTYTRGPLDNSPSSPDGIGQGLAALLLGIPSSGYISRNASQALTSKYWALYLQDNWRIRPNLTLNLGLRWEDQIPETERYNRAVNGFDPTAPLDITTAAEANYAAAPDPALAPNLFHPLGGLLYAGVNGRSRGFWNSSNGTLAPRFGFAYHPLHKMVVRGGFGIFPIQIGVPGHNEGIQTGYSLATNLVPTLDNGQTFIATLGSPYPNGILQPPGNSLGVNTYVGNGIDFYQFNNPIPYTMIASLGIQYQLPSQTLLDVSFVGNRSLKLQLGHSLDALPNQYLSTLPTRDQNTINYLSAQIANPFANLLPGTSLNGSTISRAQLLTPYPQFTGVTLTGYQGYSWYNSLQVRLVKRMSSGLTFQLAYAFSKLMEATSYLNGGDPLPTYSISSLDRPQNLSLAWVYDLPFGRGMRFFPNLGGVANEVASGWEWSTIYHLTSGAPLNWPDVFFNGNIHNIALPGNQQTPQQWFNTSAGFVTASSAQPGDHLRTFPFRLAGVRAGIVNDWDMAMVKRFQIHERIQGSIRGEFLNVFNHPYGWAPANTSPSSSAFGTVTTMYGDPRIIQLGVKFRF